MRDQGMEERRKKLTRKNTAAPASLLKPAPVPFLVLLSTTFPCQLHLRTTGARFPPRPARRLRLLRVAHCGRLHRAERHCRDIFRCKDKAKAVVEMIQRWYLGRVTDHRQEPCRPFHGLALLLSMIFFLQVLLCLLALPL